MSLDRARREFYGATVIALGAWEALAYRGMLPKITSVTRMHRRHQAIAVIYLIGAAMHLCRGKND
jgi:hypothetical protein